MDFSGEKKPMTLIFLTFSQAFHFSNSLPFKKLLMQFRTISLITAMVFLTPYVADAGSFTNYIKKKCPREFKLRQETVTEFAIRMNPFIENCGCGVVSLYYALCNNNMALIDQLEEDMEMMHAAAEVFEISDEFTSALKDSPDSVATLALLAHNDPDIFRRLSGALSSFSRHDSRQLRRNSSYLLYYLLASAMADKDTQSDDIEFIARKLKKKVSVESISALAMLYWQSIIVYPNANPEYWMRAAENALSSLGPKTVKTLAPHKERLAYFLPPTENDIPESQNISARELQKLRQDYMYLIVYVYKEITRLYSTPYALKVIEYISPAVLEALRFHHNKSEIKAYFNYEFRANIFSNAMNGGVCQTGSGDEGLKNFFIMYSPYDNGNPVPGTQGNLGLIAKWFAEGKLRQYIDEARDVNGYIYSMSLLPQIYFGLSQNQKIVFLDLLFGLSTNLTLNAQIIIALNNTTGFFSWIENRPDVFLKVSHNPDISFGESARKYKYILLTSYPKDDSPSILHSFDGRSISSKGLNHMMNMSIAELETHNFTDIERYIDTAVTVYEIAEWTHDAVWIATIPLTLGASAPAALMVMARRMAYRSARIAERRLKSRAKMALAKKSFKSIMKWAGRKGWILARQEAKDVFGIASKRGRKVAKEAIRKGSYKSNKLIPSISLGVGATTGALAYFLANQPETSPSAGLCEEISNLTKRD